MFHHVRLPSACLKGVVTLTLAAGLVTCSMAHQAQAEFKKAGRKITTGAAATLMPAKG